MITDSIHWQMYVPLEFRDINLFEALALVCVVRHVLR